MTEQTGVLRTQPATHTHHLAENVCSNDHAHASLPLDAPRSLRVWRSQDERSLPTWSAECSCGWHSLALFTTMGEAEDAGHRHLERCLTCVYGGAA